MTSQLSISRRTFAGGCALTATSLILPALYAQSKLEKTKIIISVDGKAAFGYLPLTISEQLGYFKAEGLNVEINDFIGGIGAVQAVVGGLADISSGAFENTINMQANNHMLKAFVLQGRTPPIAFGVSTKAMSNYQSIADLRGKKIGISVTGSSTNLMATLLLARAGLKLSDVSFIAVGTAAGALTALRSGQIDAVINTDPVMTMLEQKGEVKIVNDARTLKGTLEVFGGAMPAACLHAPISFIEKNPNTCQALTNAIVHGLKWLQTAGPGDIIKTVPESYLLGDRALYLASFNKVRESLSLDGTIPEDGARTALRALASFDPTLKTEKIDLSKTYTNEFARRAKERFKA